MGSDDWAKRVFQNFLITAILLTAVFMVWISYLGIQIKLNNECGIDVLTHVNTNSFIPSDFILNDTSTAILQNFNINETSNLRYTFCFGVNSSQSHKISVVDDNNKVLSKNYITSGNKIYCSDIVDELDKNVWIGIKCDTCTENNNVTISKQILGQDIEHLRTDFSTVSIIEDKSVNYKLISRNSCKRDVRFYSILYFVLIGIILILGLIILGWDFFRYELLENKFGVDGM